MTKQRYVLFREDSNTHQEVYVAAISPKNGITRTRNVNEAMSFPSAADGYRVGAWWRPQLDWWHVGQR